MHIFQKRILDLLRKSSELRYSDLQPDDVESGHFKYHLDQLIKEGAVEQVHRGVYRLTVKGKSKVDRLSSDRVNPHTTPKVITYTLLEDDKNYYLTKKLKEPYLGLINMIGGKVHEREATEEASKREVLEKVGIQLDTTKLCGVAQIQIKHENSFVSHVIAYIYSATIQYNPQDQEELIQIPKSGIHSTEHLAPDTLLIIDKVKSSGELFSIDLDIDY